MTHKLFSQSSRYRAFSAKRDAALEGFLMKGRARAGDILRRFMLTVQQEVQIAYPQLSLEVLDPRTTAQLHQLDRNLATAAHALSGELATIWTVTRAQTYVLAHASEQGALHAAGVKSEPVKLSRDDILSAAYEPTQFGGTQDRAHLALSRLRRKVMDAVEMSRILGELSPAAVKRALDAFPRPQRLKGPEKALRRITEADRPTIKQMKDEGVFTFADFVDDDEYEAILKEYTDEFVPRWRDPREAELPSGVSIGDSDGFVTYPWQLENEMTEDFVDQVESGRHDGAKAAGITTFVWVAVIDKHTDDCCIKRDGLTTAEIALKLEGEWADDDCDAAVTPAHANCRCRLVPATDDLPDVPESNAADFEEWLAA